MDKRFEKLHPKLHQGVNIVNTVYPNGNKANFPVKTIYSGKNKSTLPDDERSISGNTVAKRKQSQKTPHMRDIKY